MYFALHICTNHSHNTPARHSQQAPVKETTPAVTTYMKMKQIFHFINATQMLSGRQNISLNHVYKQREQPCASVT